MGEGDRCASFALCHFDMKHAWLVWIEITPTHLQIFIFYFGQHIICNKFLVFLTFYLYFSFTKFGAAGSNTFALDHREPNPVLCESCRIWSGHHSRINYTMELPHLHTWNWGPQQAMPFCHGAGNWNWGPQQSSTMELSYLHNLNWGPQQYTTMELPHHYNYPNLTFVTHNRAL